VTEASRSFADGPCPTDRGELALGRNRAGGVRAMGADTTLKTRFSLARKLVKEDYLQPSIHIGRRYEIEAARHTKLVPEEVTRDIPPTSSESFPSQPG